MTDDLVQRLRGDWPEILVEKHWMMDSDAIDKQREEAADRIEQLEREKAVVSDLWEQQKEIALDYLTDCNKAADRIEALEAEIERLKNQLSLETEPSPYCPICGSCGDEGCCGSKRCLYPAAKWQAGYQAGVEAAVKALKADAKLCDCAALEERECACGAWCEWKSITSARAVEIVNELKDTK